jgi:hypothetical protein
MQRTWAGIAGAIFLSLAAPLLANEPFAVRVLYCGDPGSDREADFRSFLQQNFTKVTLRDLHEFREEDANGHDVVIFDWTDIYDGNGKYDEKKEARLRQLHDKHQLPSLSQKFSRPAILVARTGGGISLPLKLKIDWLCLCLSGPAHHLRLKHPLFHAPLEVEPKLEDVPTPEVYPSLSIDSLGPTMNVWKLQTRNYPQIDPGLVSTLYGFTDSPDAEVFAQGFSSKGPDTVTLARHASFFLWGFSAPPNEMTPAGRRLFVNAVCYIRQFDGQTPLVRNRSRSREWALRWATIPRDLSDEFKQVKLRQLRDRYREHPEWIPENERGNVDAFLTRAVRDLQIAEKQGMERVLPAALRAQFGLDADKYLAYYRANFEFLHPGGGERLAVFEVDEEAKAVGPSNRRVEFLERCVADLEKANQPERALRLLRRYTNENFETAAKWRAWLNQNRNRLFFSDVGGYKFFVGPVAKPDRENHLTTDR